MAHQLWAAAAVGLAVGGAAAQPAAAPDRYEVPAAADTYPQDSPRAALGSALKAIDRDRLEYLAAHLLDPAAVDARVADRARLLAPLVDRELRAARGGRRLPADPPAFAAAVDAEARRRAFRQVVGDVRDALAENPAHLRDLRRLLGQGELAPAADGGQKLTHKEVPARAVYFRQVGDRWFVLDKQAGD